MKRIDQFSDQVFELIIGEDSGGSGKNATGTFRRFLPSEVELALRVNIENGFHIPTKSTEPVVEKPAHFGFVYYFTPST